MRNAHDLAYSGPIYLGGPEAQSLEVVYDTGSDWLTVEGSNCSECKGNTYKYTDSDSFEFLESEQSVELEYGSALLKGLRAQDRICIADESTFDLAIWEGACHPTFEFFMVSE